MVRNANTYKEEQIERLTLTVLMGGLTLLYVGQSSAAYKSGTPSDVSDRFSFGTPLTVTRALVRRITGDLIRKNA